MTTSVEKTKRKNKSAVVQQRRMLVVLCIGGLLLIGTCFVIGLATGWIKLGLSDFEIQSTNIALTNEPMPSLPMTRQPPLISPPLRRRERPKRRGHVPASGQ